MERVQGNNQELQQRLTELSTKEAELRGILAQYTFAGKRWNAAALIVLALIAGIVITLITLTLLTILK